MPWVSITLEVEPAAGDALGDALLDAAARACGLAETPAFRLTRIDDEDWVRRLSLIHI